MPSSLIQIGQRTLVPSTTQQQKSQPLKDGQIVFGVIKKHLSNQMVEVQVGNQKIIAKLTSPINKGDRQWLQVSESARGTELKVVAAPLDRASTQRMVSSLLDHLGLAKTTEMRSLVAQMVKEQWTMNKEILTKAAEFLSTSTNKQEALAIIRLMMSKGVPFTTEVFQSIKSGNQTMTPSISAQLDQLSQLIKLETASPIVTRTLTAIDSVEAPFQRQITQQTIANFSQMLGDQSAPASTRLQALQVLQQLQVLPQHATLSNWTSVAIQSLVSSENGGEVKQAITQIASGQELAVARATLQQQLTTINETLQQAPRVEGMTEKVQQMVQQIIETIHLLKQPVAGQQKAEKVFATLIQSQVLIQQLPNDNSSNLSNIMELLSQSGSKQQQLQAMLMNISTQGSAIPQLSPEAHELLFKMMAKVQGEINQQLSGKTLETMMRTVFDSLGVDYEAKLTRSTVPIDRITESLKPQLLALIQDPMISAQTKNAADSLLARFNGQQILSAENGPLQQILYQMPIVFIGQKMDVTMQWTGRKKQDGTLDPNHARILFYLQLASLNETVIDMQVQNRIVSVDFYNERDGLQALADPFIPLLKNSLEKMDYQLSTLKFFSTKEIDPPIIKPVEDQLDSFYSGVDIRI